jgi:tetratricopeptide (TPR) repeat protein
VRARITIFSATAVVIVIVLLAVISMTQSQTGKQALWQGYNRASTQAYVNGNDLDAAAQAEAALELAEIGQLDDPKLVQSLFDLAFYYGLLGRNVEAGPLIERAFVIVERLPPSDQGTLPVVLNSLADRFKRHNRPVTAERLYKQVISMQETALGLTDVNIAWELEALAEFYRDQNRFTDAEKLYKRALEIRTKAYGSNHIQTTFSLSGLAGLYQVQGRPRAGPV